MHRQPQPYSQYTEEPHRRPTNTNTCNNNCCPQPYHHPQTEDRYVPEVYLKHEPVRAFIKRGACIKCRKCMYCPYYHGTDHCFCFFYDEPPKRTKLMNKEGSDSRKLDFNYADPEVRDFVIEWAKKNADKAYGKPAQYIHTYPEHTVDLCVKCNSTFLDDLKGERLRLQNQRNSGPDVASNSTGKRKRRGNNELPEAARMSKDSDEYRAWNIERMKPGIENDPEESAFRKDYPSEWELQYKKPGNDKWGGYVSVSQDTLKGVPRSFQTGEEVTWEELNKNDGLKRKNDKGKDRDDADVDNDYDGADNNDTDQHSTKRQRVGRGRKSNQQKAHSIRHNEKTLRLWNAPSDNIKDLAHYNCRDRVNLEVDDITGLGHVFPVSDLIKVGADVDESQTIRELLRFVKKAALPKDIVISLNRDPQIEFGLNEVIGNVFREYSEENSHIDLNIGGRKHFNPDSN